jgi:hypothetical protein
VTLVYGANREYEQESERGAGDEGEEVGVGQRVDVVHLESVRDTELVDERCHKLGVGLERDEGRAAIGRIGVCCRRHFDCVLDVVWKSVLRCIGYHEFGDEAEGAEAGNETLPHVWRGVTDDVA